MMMAKSLSSMSSSDLSVSRENLCVCKFGGTSIGTPERILQMTRIVRDLIVKEKKYPIIVLSAMSKGTKKCGTTSMLLKATPNLPLEWRDSNYNEETVISEILSDIKGYHCEIISALAESNNEQWKQAIMEKIDFELEKLESFLEAVDLIGEVSDRSLDRIVATGEALAVHVCSEILKLQGIATESVFLDSLRWGKLEGLKGSKASFENLTSLLGSQIVSAITPILETGKIPIVTGFIGPFPGSFKSSLLKVTGRGYSDWTASLISTFMRSQELVLWKEVDGIYTADPNVVPEAYPLARIHWREALEMAVMGSEVVHPLLFRTERWEPNQQSHRQITIRNSQKPDELGTTIDFHEFQNEANDHGFANNSLNSRSGTNQITGITVQRGITVLSVTPKLLSSSNGSASSSSSFLGRLFIALAKNFMQTLLISTSHETISIAIPADCESRIADLENDIGTESGISVTRSLSIVSIIGSRMKAKPGMAALLFSSLAQAGINIEMISQGASEINVSCVVKESHVEEAVIAIHRQFFQSK